MEAAKTETGLLGRWLGRCIDCAATLSYWTWFILGYFLFFSWRYLWAARSVENRQVRFQRLTSQFYRVFFALVKATAPRHRFVIGEEVAAIRSAVIVCNHLSYLDPLLMIALYPQHKTIVKSRFLSLPIFGWIIRQSGYLPSSGEGRYHGLMIEQMETMPDFLEAGGNLFVFPEGTRSRDGKLGALHHGAFKIARLCKAPIYVLQVTGTDLLFTPGQFLFHTGRDNIIGVKIIDHLEPYYIKDRPSPAQLEERVRQAFLQSQP